LFGLGGGIGLILLTHNEYRASVQIFVATKSSDGNAGDLAQGNTFIEDRVQSYTSIATAPAVTGAVISKLGLDVTDQQLAKKISTSAPPNKVLINLFVTDRSPRSASLIANALAQSFSRVVEQTEQTDARGNSVVKLTVIHPATLPGSPIKPDRPLYVGLGIVVGFLLGCAIAVVRELLDNTIKRAADLETLGISVLGMIPFDKRTSSSPLAFQVDGQGRRAEAYRLLRTNLQFINVDRAPKTIAITSALVGEGKTTTAINLAAALADAGKRVFLVEADLRRPTIATAMGLVPELGLTSVLIGKVPLADALQSAGRNLAVLTSGPVPPNPSELLVSKQVRDVIAELSRIADYVVIDTAPLVPVADGAEVSALADATLLVVRTGKTSWDHAAQALAALDNVGHAAVGAVLNMVERGTGYGDYQYGYSSYRQDKVDERSAAPTTVTEPAAASPQAPPARSEPTSAAARLPMEPTLSVRLRPPPTPDPIPAPSPVDGSPSAT
jgi:non-specific protein-tyrosine kinase